MSQREKQGTHGFSDEERAAMQERAKYDTKSLSESERVVPLPASVQAGSQPQARRW